jgi:integrase
MPVDDLWYSSRRERGPDGKLLPAKRTKRHGRGKRYRVRYRDDLGAKREKLFDDGKKGEAERFDRAVHTDVARGLYVDPVAGREIVEQFGERWIDAQLYRPGTTDRVRRTLRLHVYPVLGRLPLAQVRPSHIQGWVKGLDLAPSTARVAYSCVVALFGAAVRDRAIAVTPCTGITLPAVESTEHVILTPAQVHAIADGLAPRYRAAVYLGAGCGLRGGEVLGLELDHINFLGREVDVHQQLVVQSGGAPYIGPVKTRASRRTVELPKVTANALARHLELHPVRPVEIEDHTDPRKVRTRSAELLFTTESGRPIHRATWSHIWKPGRTAADLPVGVAFHALRHYFATLLIFSGASVKTVQTALGHSTPMITLNTYVGLWPEQIDRTRTLVDAALDEADEAAVAP